MQIFLIIVDLKFIKNIIKTYIIKHIYTIIGGLTSYILEIC